MDGESRLLYGKEELAMEFVFEKVNDSLEVEVDYVEHIFSDNNNNVNS